MTKKGDFYSVHVKAQKFDICFEKIFDLRISAFFSIISRCRNYTKEHHCNVVTNLIPLQYITSRDSDVHVYDDVRDRVHFCVCVCVRVLVHLNFYVHVHEFTHTFLWS